LSASWQTVLFLIYAKKAVSSSQFTLIPRKKNLDALAEAGITVGHLKKIISDLTPENYIRGPEPDLTIPNEILWVFRVIMESTEYYLKLKLIPEKNKWNLICISFHPSDRPLR